MGWLALTESCHLYSALHPLSRTQVPVGCRSLKVQAWGAGGGSGHFKGGQCGDGGGGAFAEALLYVVPEDDLEVKTSCRAVLLEPHLLSWSLVICAYDVFGWQLSFCFRGEDGKQTII